MNYGAMWWPQATIIIEKKQAKYKKIVMHCDY